MSYNEAETRYFLIDPVLREKGYDDHQRLKLETPAPVEPIGAKSRRRRGSYRTDYLLCVQAGAIDAAVFDLKAVNPYAAARTDMRTPAEVIASIEEQGEIVSAALSKLKNLLAEPD